MNKLFAVIALGSALSLPALAQMTPAETNMDKSAARMETRNARGAQLTSVTADQARQNELQRCANLPAFYKVDCENRVNGKGEASGSVIGGGMIRETVTTMPKTELDAEMQKIQPMTLPAQRN
ncbi:hypothetical protein FVQ98_06280 [Ottowia sp. GY511]|uniref:DUF4148 domain-containing protein n=1 Tax=Ottowia flava TaxID=2675430 RepID=A0ABW4KTB5_9BURK|nr:hypothetical protein [Ottowia sp. GY511]TXK30910.1 hypothetical protein FVQ98_06280 [Ottowia sp. GY511]